MTTLTPTNASAILKTYGKFSPTPVNEVKSGIKIGLFGPGGIGKTTLAGTLCDSEFGWPVFYINARGNPNVISSRGDKVSVITPEKFKDMEDIRQDIIRDGKSFPYKSIVIDNASELWSMDLRDIYGPVRDVEWTMHSASTADLLQMFRNYCDLADGPMALNVVFVMWETPETRTLNFKEVNRSELAFNKALQSQVPGIINWLGRLYIDDEKTFRRKLDFRPIETLHVAKHQNDPADEWASQIPMEIWNPSLGTILDTLKGHVPFPLERHSNVRGR